MLPFCNCLLVVEYRIETGPFVPYQWVERIFLVRSPLFAFPERPGIGNLRLEFFFPEFAIFQNNNIAC